MIINGHSQGGKKAPYHGVEDWLLSARDILTLRVCIVLGVIVR